MGGGSVRESLLYTAGMSEYREAYATLARVARALEDGEADLDRVLPLVEEARAAYGVVRARIEAVRAALGDDWEDEEGSAAEADDLDDEDD
ncbi:Exonuclease VII small subunit [Deinococcus maricopensis DSM 21211]|uniref:Exonuclease VII small subunit n=2 Tax=Deinococcus TaxID=1298 RepID=E8U3Q3_DEIML|nr:Exonuclease VII small subunit [Deinococcus maricopensis DSM 21211]